VPGASAPQPEERTGGAARTGAARKAESLDARKGQAAARTPGDLEERPLAGGLAGRHTAARREEMAGLATLPPEPKPRLLARLIIWGTGAICGLLILATIGEAWTVHRLNQQIAANQQVVNQLQAQNQAISSSIQQLQQASTIEQEARKLGFIFPGDQPVTIVMAPPPPAPPKPAAPPAQSWWGFWSDWLKLFFGG
jgi:cell division protein FtsB